jgi:hypothetical protein
MHAFPGISLEMSLFDVKQGQIVTTFSLYQPVEAPEYLRSATQSMRFSHLLMS